MQASRLAESTDLRRQGLMVSSSHLLPLGADISGVWCQWPTRCCTSNVQRGYRGCTSTCHRYQPYVVSQHRSEDTDCEKERYDMRMETKYDNSRRYFLRVSESEFDDRTIPEILVNCYRKKGYIECQTLDLMKLNQRIEDSHQEVVLMSDNTISGLLDSIRGEIPSLFRICESIAMLDVIASFAQLVAGSKHGEYVRPELTDCLVIKSGRHPVREVVCSDVFCSPTQSH